MLLFLPWFGVQRRGHPRFPVGKSLIIPTVSLPVQSAAQAEQLPVGIVQHTGSEKPRTCARQLWFERGGFQTSAEDLGCLFPSMKREFTHWSCA
jgi:hypothetical protein